MSWFGYAVLLGCFAVLAGVMDAMGVLLPSRKSPAEVQQRYGSWAVVAGASEGLGLAWSEEVARLGLNVHMIARKKAKLEAAAETVRSKYGVKVETTVLDLGGDRVGEVALELAANPEIGLLIYNAAFDAKGSFLNTTVDRYQAVVDVNIRSPLAFTHAFATAMAKRQRGGIVLMGSMSGMLGTAWVSTYSATKSWNYAFANALYEELGPSGVDVLGCIAGATTTPHYLEAVGAGRSTLIEQTAEQVVDECMHKLGSVPSVATGPLNKLVFFLFNVLPLKIGTKVFADATFQQVMT